MNKVTLWREDCFVHGMEVNEIVDRILDRTKAVDETILFND